MTNASLWECQDCGKLVEFTEKEPNSCWCCVDQSGIYAGKNESGKNEFKEVKVAYRSNIISESNPEIDKLKIIDVFETLNRDKVLDEGIFLAMCGLDHCRTGLEITGVVRLEMAHHKIGSVIKKINGKLDNNEFPKNSCD